MWGLSAVQIEKYFKNRIIFAGDSAHSFPPAGGIFFIYLVCKYIMIMLI